MEGTLQDILDSILDEDDVLRREIYDLDQVVSRRPLNFRARTTQALITETGETDASSTNS